MIYVLHISDLHLVVNPEWNNMKKVILRHVEEKLKNVSEKEKLLIITGDFHNFKDNNYEQAEEFLPKLIKAMGIKPDRDVFVVPGNHDVFKEADTDFVRDDAIKTLKQEPSKLYEKERLNKLLLFYEPYIEFVKKIGIYKDDCDKLPVCVHMRRWEGREKLNILHLNTTIVADDKEKKNQMLDTNTATKLYDDLCKDDLPCLAIGHNSFFDLIEKQKSELRAVLENGNVSAYLCGDRHKKTTNPDEKYINFSSGTSIPNVVSYRTSSDENDDYSDFGMIWHIINENGQVDLEYLKWDKDDQANLYPDGNDKYFLRNKYKKSISPKTIKTNVGDCWLDNKKINDLCTQSCKPYHIKSFLRGSHCKWNMVFEGVIPKREAVDDLYNRVVDTGGVYALTGPGGEGKSTVLMQLCDMLIENGFDVLYNNGRGRIELPETITDNTVFVIDNPPDNSLFKAFLESVIESGYSLVLGARENEWNLLKESLNIDGRDIEEIPLTSLSEKEASDFAVCVKNYLNTSRTIEQIKSIFYKNSYGFLYAAMLLAVEDKNSLEEIAHQIIDNLSKKSHSALILLAHIVMSEQCGVDFEKRQYKPACNKLSLTPKDAGKALSKEVSLNGYRYQTRHEVIEKLFFNELFSDNGSLSLDEIDRVMINLFDFKLENYKSEKHFGDPRKNGIECMIKLCSGLEYAGLDTQKYLIERIVDEYKSFPPHRFDRIMRVVQDEKTQLLFYSICFDREWYSPARLSAWCNLLLKNGVLWNSSTQNSPAQIYRKACIEHNADSATWLAWANLEEKYSGAGEYDKENTARWIYRKAYTEQNADSSIWLAWAKLEEKYSGAGEYEQENTARWIYKKACIEQNADSATWLAWANLEEKYSGAGEYEQENTARWIYRKANTEQNADSNTWRAWAKLEEKYSGAGEYEQENTARWIYRKANTEQNADSNTWRAWAKLEEKYSGAGEYDKENTARWIYQKACIEQNADSSIWLAWAKLEEKYSGAGEYEQENTVRWIYRKAYTEQNADSNTWLAWAKLEEKYSGAGEYEQENTARWIYKKACIEQNADSATWLAWANLEEKYSGAGEYEQENTARWIYKKACIEQNADSITWRAWAKLEEKYSGAGEYEQENTARWIYRKAYTEQNADSNTWRAWAKLEEKYSGAGEYEQENTARWIYKKACIEQNVDSATWRAWAKLEEKYSGAGEYEQENTARWIYKKACIEQNTGSQTWLAWAKLEEKYSGAGEYDKENTARWIYKEMCINRNLPGICWQLWSRFEKNQRGSGDYNKENTARWILRKACIEHNFHCFVWHEWLSVELQENNLGSIETKNSALWICSEGKKHFPDDDVLCDVYEKLLFLSPDNLAEALQELLDKLILLNDETDFEGNH